MSMDISDTLAPKSDQLDAIDLATGPRIFTVKSVSKGDAEQPVQVHLVEFPRGPWRPSKNMRRVLAACWGVDASAWAGRRVELYRDPDVTFGKETPGGTRIAKLSHIDGRQTIPLLVSRGKSGTYFVDPLPTTAAPATAMAESPLGTGQTAAETVGAANPGGLIIDSEEAAARVIRAMNELQLRALKTLLGIEGTTTKAALATELYDARAGHPAEGVLLEIA